MCIVIAVIVGKGGILKLRPEVGLCHGGSRHSRARDQSLSLSFLGIFGLLPYVSVMGGSTV